MISKLGRVAALATLVAMSAFVVEASAQSADMSCKTARLYLNPESGPDSAMPVSSRYDVLYDLVGGSNSDLQPRNGGRFDAIVCNPTRYDGSYFVRYGPTSPGGSSPGQETSIASAQSCYPLRNIVNLTIGGSSLWKACVFVRYRE